jgi:hypothetical protein
MQIEEGFLELKSASDLPINFKVLSLPKKQHPSSTWKSKK